MNFGKYTMFNNSKKVFISGQLKYSLLVAFLVVIFIAVAYLLVIFINKYGDKKDYDNLFFTRDTHYENYLDTQEGKKLPVPHCIRDTEGWQIRSELDALRKTEPIDKETFGSTDLAGELVAMNEDNEIESITFVGLCTDICVISNALLAKASLPEVPIIVDAKCCAGVTPESHENALKAMEVCQIQIDR